MKHGTLFDRLRPEPPSDGWLVRDGKVLASAELAEGRVAKTRGLLGRRGIDGVMVIGGTRSVHSFFMAFELDVAFLDRNNVVIRTMRLHQNRITLPVWRAKTIVEAEAGAFGRWDLNVGDEVEIRYCASESNHTPSDDRRQAGTNDQTGHDITLIDDSTSP